MSYYKYNLPGLWFQIYREVLQLNEKLEHNRLDKVQLREVSTAIFIASTNRGIVRPYGYTKFQVELLEITKNAVRESKREEILSAVKAVLNGSRKKKEQVLVSSG